MPALTKPPTQPECVEVPLPAYPLEDLARFATPADWTQLRNAMEGLRSELAGAALWTVNSTAAGGGVAEMLRWLAAYCRGAGIDAHWLVIGGTPDFFAITKRIHNMVHGDPGDGGPLGARERTIYEQVLTANARSLAGRIAPGDVVVLHDPQTAGLVPHLAEQGATVVWRCHMGSDLRGPLADAAWDFLVDDLRLADHLVASPRAMLPPALAGLPVDRIAPSIDPRSPKHLGIAPATAWAILARAGLVDERGVGVQAAFRRRDGSPAPILRAATVRRIEAGFRPGSGPLIVHLGRWDRLKDPVGVLESFVRHVPARLDAHLMLAGPATDAVTDDPEGRLVLEELERAWAALSLSERRRVTVATLPMDDLEENGAIVNALQRRADVVVKKSLHEGFGLGISEALWKRRPVVATRVGGIPEQVTDGVSGVLVDDPTDIAAFGGAVTALLDHPAQAGALGRRGHWIVRRRFLAHRQLVEWARVIRSVRSAPSRVHG